MWCIGNYLCFSFFRLKKLNVKLKGASNLIVDYEGLLKEKEGLQEQLKESNEQISKSLKLQDRVLFSKVLKISVYKDTVKSLVNDITGLIEDHETIGTNKLLFIEKNLRTMVDDDCIWQDFNLQFEKIRPDFFKKLKEIAPNLSVNELKHCTYIVAKLKTKEVASLINVSPRSVETARYRIKKKLNLNTESSLYSFLQDL